MEKMSRKELQRIKGGIWIYNEKEDAWYWIEPKGLDPFNP